MLARSRFCLFVVMMRDINFAEMCRISKISAAWSDCGRYFVFELVLAMYGDAGGKTVVFSNNQHIGGCSYKICVCPTGRPILLGYDGDRHIAQMRNRRQIIAEQNSRRPADVLSIKVPSKRRRRKC